MSGWHFTIVAAHSLENRCIIEALDSGLLQSDYLSPDTPSRIRCDLTAFNEVLFPILMY